MGYRDILLHLTEDKRSDEKTAVAFALARRSEAKVTALYTIPFANQFYYMGGHVPPTFIKQWADEALDAAEIARSRFEAAVEQAEIPAAWIQTEQRPVDAIERLGRQFDIAVVGQADPDADQFALNTLGTNGLAADLALSLGRPVVVVPYIGHYKLPLHSVVVAWDGGREATRAVHDAIPLLTKARSVRVLGIDADDEQKASAEALVRHLQHHGVAAKAHFLIAGDAATGEILLSTLADISADLLVLGAYGHGRLRETVLGGVTDTVLQGMTAPVFLSN